jgi:hypothetical protein
MRKLPKVDTWVVYLMTLHGKPGGVTAVCEQGEWDAMERDRPGYHKLVQTGIQSEAEAEKVARAGQAVETPKGSKVRK